jgi:kynureninase
MSSVHELDANDPLRHFQEQFERPHGLIYLDGNSLGMLPKRARERVQHVVTQEWGQQLIRGWTDAGWIELPRRVGDKIGRLIGAPAASTVCADSTSINLFKVVSAALALRPDRRSILSTADNFPTDLYMAEGATQMLGKGHRLVHVDAHAIVNTLDADTAVVMLTHVNYKTGERYDMADISRAAHSAGALIIWDLAHSAGAFPLDIAACDVDFAVGCGYKYLNGGPGAPAFLYVAKRHQAQFEQPLSGWMGHAHPFAFAAQYAPAAGIDRYLCGTPPVISMSALDASLDLMLEADIGALRAKSVALTQLFIQSVEIRCAGFGLELATPRDARKRGSQVSFRHEHGYAIMQALIAAGVIGDFRAPDIIRFGFAPLYNTFADADTAATRLADILRSGAWQAYAKTARRTVT